jgi:hypothetical protein
MPSFPCPPGNCPQNIAETAEAYTMKRLSTSDTLQFAIHCLTCRECAAATKDAEGFVRAMKRAARQLSGASGVRPRLCSRWSFTSVTMMPLGNASAKMLFDVTVCVTPGFR